MARDIRRVAVFCGSNHGVDPAFTDLAVELGALLAKRGIGLVYGGGDVGLMGEVADACGCSLATTKRRIAEAEALIAQQLKTEVRDV